MRKVINIDIPEPCHENWNQMTSANKGRHCAACSKTVIDFTKTADEDLITTLEKTGNLCGRFRNNQLNRDIVLSRKDKNNYLNFFASSFFAFLSLGSTEANAQNEPKPVKIDSIQVNSVKGKIASSVLVEKIIKGTVTSNDDNLPLPGATISVKGTTISVRSDFDGDFTLKVKPEAILEISYIGYKTLEVEVSKLKNNNISLVMEEDFMGEIVITTGIICYSEPSYVYSPEALERKRLNEKRRQNQSAFYQRKYQEEKAARKAKRSSIRNGHTERTATGKFLYNLTNIFRKKE